MNRRGAPGQGLFHRGRCKGIMRIVRWVPLLACLNASIAIGDTVARPYSYSVESPAKNYIFVMIAAIANEALHYDDKSRDTIRKLRTKYRISGMYANDESTSPLWTVDWYAHRVLVPSDGIHLIRQGPWAESRFTEAIAFFESGKKIRSYRVADFVDTTVTLPHSVSHFGWERSLTLDDSGKTVTLVTANWDRYVIDYTTATIISAFRPMRVAAVSIPIILSAAVVGLFRRRRKNIVVMPKAGTVHGIVKTFAAFWLLTYPSCFLLLIPNLPAIICLAALAYFIFGALLRAWIRNLISLCAGTAIAIVGFEAISIIFGRGIIEVLPPFFFDGWPLMSIGSVLLINVIGFALIVTGWLITDRLAKRHKTKAAL
jgi:hypothetical protein